MAGTAATTSRSGKGPGIRRWLIVNADDLGLSAGVNRGIIESAERGVVTSASMIVNMSGWPDAVERLGVTPARIGIGLHLNVVAGSPLTAAPSITDSRTGKFYSLPRLVMRTLMGSVNPEDVAIECSAQLARLESAGIRATHIDSHRHVHALGGIHAAVHAVAHAHGIRVVRRPIEPLATNTHHRQATLRKVVLATSWHATAMAHRAVLRQYEPYYVDHFFGISLQGGRRFTERLDRIVDDLPEGTSEIMVHPGYDDAVLATADSYTWQREREIEPLTSRALRTRLGRRGIELVDFGSLYNAPTYAKRMGRSDCGDQLDLHDEPDDRSW